MTIITIATAIILLATTYQWSQCNPARCAVSSAAVIALLTTVTGISPIAVLCWGALFLAMMFWLPSIEGKRVCWQVGGLVLAVA